MLDIYESATPTSAFSLAGSFSNPFSVTADGVEGEAVETKVYLRNDSALYYYTGISVQPVDTGDDIVDGSGATLGYEWKLYAGDQQPTAEQWDLVAAGNSISLSNLGSAGTPDTSTYLPFWVRVKVPRWAPVRSYSGVQLRITYTQTGV